MLLKLLLLDFEVAVVGIVVAELPLPEDVADLSDSECFLLEQLVG